MNNGLFVVPNDAEGEYFFHLCQKFAVKGVGFRRYGRHPQRKQAVERHGISLNMHGDIPLEYAKTHVIYPNVRPSKKNDYPIVFGPKSVKELREMQRRTWQAEMRLNNLRRALDAPL